MRLIRRGKVWWHQVLYCGHFCNRCSNTSTYLEWMPFATLVDKQVLCLVCPIILIVCNHTLVMNHVYQEWRYHKYPTLSLFETEYLVACLVWPGRYFIICIGFCVLGLWGILPGLHMQSGYSCPPFQSSQISPNCEITRCRGNNHTDYSSPTLKEFSGPFCWYICFFAWIFVFDCSW